jgi:hypothetical protein
VSESSWEGNDTTHILRSPEYVKNAIGYQVHCSTSSHCQITKKRVARNAHRRLDKLLATGTIVVVGYLVLVDLSRASTRIFTDGYLTKLNKLMKQTPARRKTQKNNHSILEPLVKVK